MPIPALECLHFAMNYLERMARNYFKKRPESTSRKTPSKPFLPHISTMVSLKQCDVENIGAIHVIDGLRIQLAPMVKKSPSNTKRQISTEELRTLQNSQVFGIRRQKFSEDI